MTRPAIGWGCAALFVASVWLANYFVHNVGTPTGPDGPHIIDVGFGLSAPSGVLIVGIAFTLRDIVHRSLGPWVVIGAIILGAILSLWISPAFAVASAVAFLFSEFADMTVYTPLAERNWLGAVVASNVVGLVVDSLLFLWLAFGSLEFLWGQVVGKAWMTAAAILLLVALRSNRGVLARHA